MPRAPPAARLSDAAAVVAQTRPRRGSLESRARPRARQRLQARAGATVAAMFADRVQRATHVHVLTRISRASDSTASSGRNPRSPSARSFVPAIMRHASYVCSASALPSPGPRRSLHVARVALLGIRAGHAHLHAVKQRRRLRASRHVARREAAEPNRCAGSRRQPNLLTVKAITDN